MKLSRLLLLPLLVLSAYGEGATLTNADQKVTAAAVEGNNAFAVSLYGQLGEQKGNLFFSPESISTALAMAYGGARGETAAQMAKALDFALPPNQLHPAMGALLKGLNAPHDGFELNVANALWAQQGYHFLDSFLSLLKTDYGAGLEQVDFKGATEAVRQMINHWVEQKTQDKIRDLLQPGSLRADTRLVLTNAIYFKSSWQTPFDKSATKDEDFYLSPEQKIVVPFMHREGSYGYFESRGFQALEIPYQRNELSMIVFLPRDRGGLATFEQSLTAEHLQQWMSQVKGSRVAVSFPGFKMTQEFALSSTLARMGMPLAFSSQADFSGMTGSRDLTISDVIHKAYVDVNEAGTEAAAATAITMRAMAIRTPPQPPVVFRADHPFLFLIRDNQSNSILFLGRVADPRG